MVLCVVCCAAASAPVEAYSIANSSEYAQFEGEIYKLVQKSSFGRKIGVPLVEKRLKTEIKNTKKHIKNLEISNQTFKENIYKIHSGEWDHWHSAAEIAEIEANYLAKIEKNLDKIPELNEKVEMLKELVMRLKALS